MIYSVKAKFIEEKMEGFYQKLTDGTVQNQKSDGSEIINSMKCAKITTPHTILWYEMCFCSPSLNHERETVYNHYLMEMKTEIIDNCTEFDGESFFGFLEKQFKNKCHIFIAVNL